MGSPLAARLASYWLIFQIIIGVLFEWNLAELNKENWPISNYDYLDSDFELLNNAVKRQTKGSCSCTCETRPISHSSAKNDDENKNEDDDEKKGNDSAPANILRTGVSKQASHRAGKQASQQTANKSGAVYGNDYGNAKMQKSSGTPASDSRILSDMNHMDDYGFPENDFDRAMWTARQHETEDKGREHGASFKSRHDKENALGSESKSTEIGMTEGSWGHGSRFPWKHLPTRMCFRDPCTKDSDCCLKFNLCDRSARICVDCWHRSSCITEAQCCEKYPYCKRDPAASDSEPSGKCVKHL